MIFSASNPPCHLGGEPSHPRTAMASRSSQSLTQAAECDTPSWRDNLLNLCPFAHPQAAQRRPAAQCDTDLRAREGYEI
eukprot:c8480_g1_i1 orf=384-620(-)